MKFIKAIICFFNGHHWQSKCFMSAGWPVHVRICKRCKKEETAKRVQISPDVSVGQWFD